MKNRKVGFRHYSFDSINHNNTPFRKESKFLENQVQNQNEILSKFEREKIEADNKAVLLKAMKFLF